MNGRRKEEIKMKVQQKWRLNEQTIHILKDLGIKNISEDNFEDVIDILLGEISGVAIENEDRLPKEELAKYDVYEEAVDDLNDHFDQGLDYEWINSRLAE